jgi:hypothetical protein
MIQKIRRKTAARTASKRNEASVSELRIRGVPQSDAESAAIMHATKHRLIEAGLGMLLEQGYNSLGFQRGVFTTTLRIRKTSHCKSSIRT